MVLDFAKGKYGLQLIILLFVVLISGLIFQLLGIVTLNSFFNFSFEDITSANSSQLIMENEHGYWIFFVLMVLNSLGMFILSSILFSKLISGNPTQYLLLNKKPSFQFLILLPLFALAGVFLVSFMGELNMKLNLPKFFSDMESDRNGPINFIVSGSNSGNIFTTIFIMAVVPAIGEELFFRGILQKIFIQWTKKNWVGIFITAFIFSAIHFQFLTFLPRFFMGIMLGYLFVWSRNLIVPILAHFLHNLISIWIASSSENIATDNTEPTNLWLVLASMVIISAISYRYYLLSKKTHV